MHTRTAAIGVAAALYGTGGGMTSLRGRMLVFTPTNELKGYKGSIAISIDKQPTGEVTCQMMHLQGATFF